MTTTQELVIERIVTEVQEAHKIIVADDRQYANTGTLRSFDAETLAELAFAGYDFQRRTITFGPSMEPIASFTHGRPRRDGMREYVVSTVPELIDRVVAHLTGGGAA